MNEVHMGAALTALICADEQLRTATLQLMQVEAASEFGKAATELMNCVTVQRVLLDREIRRLHNAGVINPPQTGAGRNA